MTYLAPVLIAYIIGVVSSYHLWTNNNLVPFFFIFLSVLSVLLALKIHLNNRFSAAFIPIILLSFLLGYFLAQTSLIRSKNQELSFLENKEIDLTAKITNITCARNDKIIIEALPSGIIYENVSYKTKFAVNLYADNNIKNSLLSVDDIIQAKKIKMVTPALPSYPGQFNYQKYLLQKGITYIIYAEGKTIEIVGKENKISPRKAVFAARKNIMSFFDRTLCGDESKFLGSLVLGESNILPESLNDAFIKTGTLHIIAASGFNVSILIAFCFFIGNIFGPKKTAVCVFSIFLIIIYTALCNFSPSIVRAAVMGVFVMTGTLFDREKDSFHLFILSAFLMLLFKPLWLFSTGFQLSFISCLGIMAITPLLIKKLSFLPKYLNGLISTSLGAQIFLFPVLIYYFGKISSVFLISNILLVPIVEFLMPLSLIHIILGYALKIFAPITSFFCWALSVFFLKIIYFLSSAPFSLISFSKPDYLTFIIFYGFMLIILFKYYRPKENLPLKTILSCIFTAVLLIVLLKLINSNNLTVVFFNAKGGESVFIKAPHGKNILIDAGGRYCINNRVSDSAIKTIIPYLKQLGVKKLDMVIISHPHKDHMGGLLSLMRSDIPIKTIAGNFQNIKNIMTEKTLTIMRIKNIEYLPLKANDALNIGKDLNFFVMYPDDMVFKKMRNNADINNTSLAIKLLYKDASFLFTGDIQKEAEEKLTRGANLKSDVLKVAHQGSKTSTSDFFIKKVNPIYAVISADKYNRFGHPDKKVINILKANRVKYFITSVDGPIVFKTNGKKIVIYSEKPL